MKLFKITARGNTTFKIKTFKTDTEIEEYLITLSPVTNKLNSIVKLS